MLPFMQWLPYVDKATVRADAWAGLTNAVVVLPQGVAYALIAGLPPQYGLYTAIVPAFIAALFGSSRHLISGPTAALSILVFATLSPIAEVGSDEYIQMALTLAVLAGVIQIALGVARLGALIDLISPAVVTGFTAGAAILIITSQLRHVLGIDIPRTEQFFDTWLYAFAHAEQIQPGVLATAGTSLVVVIGIRQIKPEWPSLLLAMVAGAAAGLGLTALGYTVPGIGEVPGSLPPPTMPALELSTIKLLAPDALALALLGLIEAISIGRAISLKSHQRLDGNQEFIGQGLSNLVGGFMSCYPASGSFTRSGVNYSSGARTPLSGIFAATLLALIIIFFAPLARYLPTAAMGGMIVVVAWTLIDFGRILTTLRSSFQSTFVLAATFFATLLIDLAFAILGGVLISMLLFVLHVANPSIFSLAPNANHPKRRLSIVRRNQLTECPQLKILRLDGSLFFGSIHHVAQTLHRVREGSDARKHVLLVGAGVNYIDMEGARMLVHEARKFKAIGGGLYLCSLRLEARNFLYGTNYATAFGTENIFSTKSAAIETIFERLERPICERCTARIFSECGRLPYKPSA